MLLVLYPARYCMKALRAFRHPWLLMASLLLGNAAGHSAEAPTHLSHGRFRDVLVFQPSGPAQSFALLLSGDEGWTPTSEFMARTLVQRGAMVTGIDWAALKADLEADSDQCL